MLSGRPDMVTGEDVLVGAPADSTFRIDGERADATEVRPEQWLVTGLEPGRHVITVGTPTGREQLRVRVFPITGPVFSGPHLPLLACSTEQAGLGRADRRRLLGTDQGRRTSTGRPRGAFAPLARRRARPGRRRHGHRRRDHGPLRRAHRVGRDRPGRLLDLDPRPDTGRGRVRRRRVERPARVPVRRRVRPELRPGLHARDRHDERRAAEQGLRGRHRDVQHVPGAVQHGALGRDDDDGEGALRRGLRRARVHDRRRRVGRCHPAARDRAELPRPARRGRADGAVPGRDQHRPGRDRLRAARRLLLLRRRCRLHRRPAHRDQRLRDVGHVRAVDQQLPHRHPALRRV